MKSKNIFWIVFAVMVIAVAAYAYFRYFLPPAILNYDVDFVNLKAKFRTQGVDYQVDRLTAIEFDRGYVVGFSDDGKALVIKKTAQL